MTEPTSKQGFSCRVVFWVARPNLFDRAHKDAFRCTRHAQASLGRGTRFVAVLAFVSLLVISAGCGKSPKDTAAKTQFEVDKVYEKGPATVHVRLDKTKMTIADTVLLQFEASLPSGYEIQMPKVDKALENFGMVDWNNLGKKLDDKNNVVTTYQYRLEPLLSGKYDIPAFTFRFHDVNDPNATHELASEPIPVEVTSLLGDQRAHLVIEDIEGVVEIPRAPSHWWLWTLIVLGAAAVPAAWLLLRRRRAKKLVRIFRPAHELAYARLRALVAENLVEQGRIEEFYERISGILRHYIEDRFDLHAPERTTEEFLDELRHAQTLAPADKSVLEEFLIHCDLVKFAQHDPTTEQVQRTFDLVKDFIEKTRSEERKVDVTDKMAAADTPGRREEGEKVGAAEARSGLPPSEGSQTRQNALGDPALPPLPPSIPSGPSEVP
jgi:hypothetical protein